MQPTASSAAHCWVGPPLVLDPAPGPSHSLLQPECSALLCQHARRLPAPFCTSVCAVISLSIAPPPHPTPLHLFTPVSTHLSWPFSRPFSVTPLAHFHNPRHAHHSYSPLSYSPPTCSLGRATIRGVARLPLSSLLHATWQSNANQKQPSSDPEHVAHLCFLPSRSPTNTLLLLPNPASPSPTPLCATDLIRLSLGIPLPALAVAYTIALFTFMRCCPFGAHPLAPAAVKALPYCAVPYRCSQQLWSTSRTGTRQDARTVCPPAFLPPNLLPPMFTLVCILQLSA